MKALDLKTKRIKECAKISRLRKKVYINLLEKKVDYGYMINIY